MKKALWYVFLVWISTIIISPLLYYYAFGAEGMVMLEGAHPDRQLSLIVTYPFTILYSLPAVAILVFVAAIINRELQNPPLKKMLIGLSGAILIILIFYIAFKSEIKHEWDLVAVYCGVAILASLIYKLSPK